MGTSVDYNAIGQRIKERRKERGWTQDLLAESLSVSVGYISQIERGVTKISLDTMAEIARQLECDITEFLSGVVAGCPDYLEREMSQAFHQMSDKQKKQLLDTARIILKYK